jgi:Carboxypeptidase regulatory-like domain
MVDGAGVVRGTVHDAAGNPVAGASVFFTSGPAPLQDIAALTDSEGRFALSAPVPGTYQLEAHGAESGSGKASVTVPGAGESEVVVELR